MSIFLSFSPSIFFHFRFNLDFGEVKQEKEMDKVSFRLTRTDGAPRLRKDRDF